MNLPNYINFEPFNRLRRQMRTSQLGHFSIHGKNAPDASPPDVVDAIEIVDTPAKKTRSSAKKVAASPAKKASAKKPTVKKAVAKKAATKPASTKSAAKPATKASATKTSAKKAARAKKST